MSDSEKFNFVLFMKLSVGGYVDLQTRVVHKCP